MATYPTSPVPVYVYTQVLSFKTIVSDPNMGILIEQRRAKWPKTGLRSWALQYKYTDSGSDTLWDFYQARCGPWESFTFVDPDPNGDGTSYTARFIDGSMTRSLFTYQAYSTGVRILQVI